MRFPRSLARATAPALVALSLATSLVGTGLVLAAAPAGAQTGATISLTKTFVGEFDPSAPEFSFGIFSEGVAITEPIVLGIGESFGPLTVDPGTYEIREEPQEGFTPTPLCFINGRQVADETPESPEAFTFTLAEGDEGGCLFANASTTTPPPPAKATVTLIKDTVPDLPENFTFTLNGTDPFLADLTDDGTPGSQNQVTGTVDPGLYSLDESPFELSGFDNTISCRDTAGGERVDLDTTNGNVPFELDLAAGDDVTCTITNTLTSPRLTLVKDVHPSGLDASFDFTVTGPDGPTNVSLQGSDGFNVAPGPYTITELPFPGGLEFTLESITCVDDVDGSPIGTVTLPDAEVAFTLGENQRVTCTFVNDLVGPSIKIVKDSVPDAPFAVNFSLTEDPAPDPQLPFLNPTNFLLTDGGEEDFLDDHQVLIGTPGTTYTVTEGVADSEGEGELPEGVTVSAIDCDNPAVGPVIDLATRQLELTLPDTFDGDVVCTFTNQVPSATVTIIKDTDPDGPQEFEFLVVGDLTADATPVTLVDDGDDATAPFNSTTFEVLILPPDPEEPAAEIFGKRIFAGAVELAAANGFDLVDITCINPTRPVTAFTVTDLAELFAPEFGEVVGVVFIADLQDGDDVTCTFTNRDLNTPPGDRPDLTVAVEGSDPHFEITGPGGFSESFDLDPVIDPTTTFADLAPGAYEITVSGIEAGTVLDGIGCAPPGAVTAGPTFDETGGTVTVEIGPDDSPNVACIFATRELKPGGDRPDLTVAVEGSDPHFEITGPGGFSESFDLDPATDPTTTFADLAPGAYELTVSGIEAGTVLDGIGCAPPGAVTAGPTFDETGGTVTVEIGPDDSPNVACIFATRELKPPADRPDLTIEVQGGDPHFEVEGPGGFSESFDLDPDTDPTTTFADLAPGEYQITISDIEAGTVLDGIGCVPPAAVTDGPTFDENGGTVTVEIGPDGSPDVTCRFLLSDEEDNDDGYNDYPGDSDFDFDTPFDNPGTGSSDVGGTTAGDGPTADPVTSNNPTQPLLAILGLTGDSATPPAAAPVSAPELPRTGTGAGPLVLFGLGVLVAGMVARTLGRRHRLAIR